MTTNWQDKYKDLEVGQSAWYWHKPKVRWPKWEAIRVERNISMQDGCPVLVSRSIFSEELSIVSEDYPNGPRCLTPDEISKLIDINVVANSEDC